jgi:hypothetical protein
MKKMILFLWLGPATAASVMAQVDTTNLPRPLVMTAEQDHRAMMKLLHIDSLRPGADGNHPDAPNAANYDEAKANPYPQLPDPLVLKNGQRVTTVKQWWGERRPEIVADFDREVYGRVPVGTPKVNWEVVSAMPDTVGGIRVVTKKLIGRVDNSAYPFITVNIELTLTVPADAAGPVPVIMEFGFVFPAGMRRPGVAPAAGGAAGTGAGGGAVAGVGAPGAGATAGAGAPAIPWQQQVLAKGWGYAIYYPASVQADNGAGLTRGIIGLMNKGQLRKPDDWGALRAWAWGASRVLDYFETDKTVDARRVGVEGHSRFGKAAIVTMAYDSRFATGFISSSGEGGVKLSRRNAGEIVENVAGAGEYHWMAGNFLKYAGPLHWNDLPVDAHELVALCAPRPVFISAGQKGDGWQDARGMFMAAVAAGPVYRLLGKKDLGVTEFPLVETPLVDGEIAWRQHTSGHTPVPNWPTFLDYAGRYFKRPGDRAGAGGPEVRPAAATDLR